MNTPSKHLPQSLRRAFPPAKPATVPFALLMASIAWLGAEHSARAAAYTWNGTGASWSSAASWTPNSGAGGPLPNDSATFGNTGASTTPTTVNNMVDAGFAGTISNLTYNSAYSSTASPVSPLYNVTQIPSGKILSVPGNFLVGGLNEGAGAYLTYAYLTGGGTLAVTGTNFVVQNYGSASGANAAAYLNLSGLGYFVYSNSIGTFGIANNPGSLTRLGGNVTLAAVSNSITALNVNIATSTSAQAGPLSTLVLGPGTNLINAANFNLANNKNSMTVSFAAPYAGLRLRGVSGADGDRPPILLGNRSVSGGTGTTTGSLLLSGSTVNIQSSTLTIGDNSGATAGTYGVGNLLFDTGTVDATTVNLANAPSAGNATGTLTVGTNGTLIVGSGGLSLVNSSAAGTCAGTLNISNGTVICNGPISVGTAYGTSTINFINGGRLYLGSGSVAGNLALPLGNLNLIEGSTVEFGLPSLAETNIVANAVTWPNDDSLLTFAIDSMPANSSAGTIIPLIQFASLSGGTFTAPALKLPPGVTGTLSITDGNLLILTITGGVGPGTGGVSQLANAGFESFPATAGWSATGNASVTTVGTATYLNSPLGACGADSHAELVVSHTGTNVARLGGSNLATGSTNVWSQSVPVAAGATVTSGAFTYVSHEDLLTGKNSFYYELDFRSAGGTLLASYKSYVITNLTCGETTPFPLDSWVYLPLTNALQVVAGVNTGIISSNVPSGILTAPPQSASMQFRAVLLQQGPPDNTDGGSVYLDDVNLGLVASPVPPVLSAVTPDLITFCTNTTLAATVTSAVTAITSVQVIVQTTTLGGITTNTVTNTVTSPYLTVTGLGTSSVGISYALATNTVYPSVIVRATDANGITVSATNQFDTLVPTLVVEASDYNFSSGQFLDTPPDGGLALYVGQVGNQGVDYNKGSRTAATSYYRPYDTVILQAAAPETGTPPTATEQKFVTAAANGDTTDVQLEAGYNSPGDWLNYSRTFGPGGSAPAGTYNVWCYLATSGTGVQSTFSQLTSDPTQGNQTTNFLGYFGTSKFSDNGYNNYRYVPLVDQFGNLVSLTISNGVQTFKSTVVGNPNLSFYLFVPVAPVYTPVLQNVSPDGSVPYQSSGEFAFTVGAANGAPVTTNGIGLVLNGEPVTSGLVYTKVGNSWTVTYAIASNQVYTAVINVTNLAGLSSTYTSSFDTFSVSNFTWEAVDYDFSTNDGSGNWLSGQFIDYPVPTADATAPLSGTLATNSFFDYPTGLTPSVDGYGAIAQPGIDINWANPQTGTAQYYRADGVGSQPATDYVRPAFLAAQQIDPNVGQFNIGYFNAGNWLNYTRTYPTNYYTIWGRLAGGNGAFNGTTLGIVTSGVGTATQTVNVLGSFADPAPAGWQTYHWIPLLDTNGNQVVVQLGGQATLRVTSGNNLNAEFFMLAPASPPAGSFTIAAHAVGNHLLISIPTQTGHEYTLWTATTLTSATWSPVGAPLTGNGTTQVITVPLNSATSQGYFRVLAQ